MDALVLSTGTALDGVRRWADLPRDERKRRAAAACRDRDTETLTDLTLSHLVLHGRAGAQVSRHTRQSYAIAVRQLVHAWRGQSLIDPSPDAGALWLRSMEEAGASASTVSVRLAGARALYAALRWTGAVTSDPLAGIRPARDPTPAWSKRAPYSQAELDAMLAAADVSEAAFLLLCGFAGCRISEALGLCWVHVDLRVGEAVIRGKGGKVRTVPLGRRLVAALEELPRTGDVILPYGSAPIARRRLQALCERAGTRYRGVHSLRHYCGTRIYRETGKLEIAQQLLGHSDISTTQVYAHMADDTVRRAVGEW